MFKNNKNGEIYIPIKSLADNAMLKVNPKLWEEWDFVNNENENIYKITKSSGKKVWWNCSRCDSSFQSSVVIRVNNSKCPYCLGRKVNNTNSLAVINPELAKQWHPIKNGELTPNDVSISSGKRVWWTCNKGHDWETTVGSRNYSNCPYCSNFKVWKGYNDLFTTDNQLALKLLNIEDSYKYTKASKIKLDWKCECGQIIKNKSPFIVRNEGLGCPCKSKGKSYPEKFIYYLLRELNLEFEWEKTFKWSDNKRYDFYLPSYNLIIEVHGLQHYEQGFGKLGGRSLEEEQFNDELKYNLALKNNINKYITINASYSKVNWMIDEILKSELSKLFNLSYIDWELIHNKALKEISKEAYELWSEYKSINKISEIMSIDVDKIKRYLTFFSDFDINEDNDLIAKKQDKYIKDNLVIDLNIETLEEREYLKDENQKTHDINHLKMKRKQYTFNKYYYDKNKSEIMKRVKEINKEKSKIKKIYQYDYEFNLIKVWQKSHYEIGDELGLAGGNLRMHLEGKQDTFNNHLWCYEGDYKNMVNRYNPRLIHQFNFNGELLKSWRSNSVKEMYEDIELNFKHIKKKVLKINHYYKGYIFLKDDYYDSIKDKNTFFSKLKDKYQK